MDIQMPVMDGIQATKKIRLFEEEIGVTPVKIIAVTSFVTEQDHYDCFDVGMNGFPRKPVRQTEILENLMNLCN